MTRSFFGLLAPPALALCLAPLGQARAADAVVVRVRADQPQGRFVAERYTNTSFGPAYGELTSSNADAAFAWVRATNALSYVRCYNWLGDGVPKGHPQWLSGAHVASKGPDGRPVYQWERLEYALDALIASGVKPVVVCGGMPDALIKGPVRRNDTGQAVNSPAELAQYHDMLAQMFRRLEKTYGAKEVRTWYFEVWDQPDHEGSWEGGRPAPFSGEVSPSAIEPFNRIYDHFAAAAAEVDPRIRVGGPGTAGDASFLKRFLEHCARGTNAVTGRPGARVDFISTHAFGSVDEIVKSSSELRATVGRDYPELKTAELLLSEVGSGAADAPRANTSYEAARLAALVDGTSRVGGPDMVFRAGDLIDDHFDGNHPLITRLGQNTVPTPAFRLYMLLAKMSSQRLAAEAPAGIGAIAARAEEKGQQAATQILVYRYDPSATADGSTITTQVRISGLPAGLIRLPMRAYRIDAQSPSPYDAWVVAGKPRPAPQELGAKLVGREPFAPVEENPGLPINNGEATVDLELPPNSVALVTIGAEPSFGAQLSERGERLRHAEDDFAEAAVLLGPNHGERGVDALRAFQKKYADTAWAETALYSLVGVYDLDLKRPAEAEAARKELLDLPIDDFLRLRLLERLRADSVRRDDKAQTASLSRRIAALEAQLKAEQEWPVKRYAGPGQ